jgi:energy-coupling factor transporter ATP-binding protein EcfA2
MSHHYTDADAEQQKICLRKFDFSMLDPDRCVLLVGKRGTGKSVLLRDILSYLTAEYDFGIAMSPTPESQDMFREFMPDMYIYDEYDGDKIAEIVDTLRKYNHNGIYRRVFVLLDDCMFDSKVLKSLAMRDIHMNGRHLKILFLNIVQYTMDVPKALRAQIDFVFALREPQREYRLNLYKNFFGVFETYEQFAEVLDVCTENYGCIVINNMAKSNNIEDTVFWYRASPKPPAFLLGGRNYWKAHYCFYEKPDYTIPEDESAIPALVARRRKEGKGGGDEAKSRADASGGKSASASSSSHKHKRKDRGITVEKREIDGSIIIEPDPAPPSMTTAAAAPPPPSSSRPPPPSLHHDPLARPLAQPSSSGAGAYRAPGPEERLTIRLPPPRPAADAYAGDAAGRPPMRPSRTPRVACTVVDPLRAAPPQMARHGHAAPARPAGSWAQEMRRPDRPSVAHQPRYPS